MTHPTIHDVIVFLLGALAASILRALFFRPRNPGVPPPTLGVAPTIGVAPTTVGIVPSPDIEALLRQGKKIEAIKIYREQTGVGLKDAKDAVEAMERQMM